MSLVDDLNYARDPRTQGAAKAPILYLDDGTEIELPTRWEVCGVCYGEGKHVNPSIDAGGISASQFAEDPFFEGDYFAGVYDVTCSRCGGRTTVRVVDIDALTPELKHAYAEQLREEAADRAYALAELRMGA